MMFALGVVTGIVLVIVGLPVLAFLMDWEVRRLEARDE